MGDAPPFPGAPRWVKISGTIAIVLALLFVVLQLTGVIGRHGPGRHGGGREDQIPNGGTNAGRPGGDGEHAPHGVGHR